MTLLFSPPELREHFTQLTNQIAQATAGLPDSEVLAEDAAAVVQKLSQRFTIEPVVVDFASMTRSAPRGVSRRVASGGQEFRQSALEFTVTVPYTGDGVVFARRASSFSVSGQPEADVRPGQLIFRVVTDEPLVPDQFNSQVANFQTRVNAGVERGNADLAVWNASVQSTISTALSAEKRKRLETMDALGQLNVPEA